MGQWYVGERDPTSCLVLYIRIVLLYVLDEFISLSRVQFAPLRVRVVWLCSGFARVLGFEKKNLNEELM